MRIRDALESDAEALATAIDRPRGVVKDMIHDRSVRVAVTGDGGNSDDDDSGGENSEGEDSSTVAGFVAFDARGDIVHVTDFDGDDKAIPRLFEEPRRFARREGMSVEVVVPDDERTGELLEDAGFESVGPGPRFEGRRTTRYVVDSADLD
ncbi:hypothetical protein [Halorubrum lipolyticum]|uniref:N-acetyltransferase domain-containing protein n=1 Tax=Halorubrum lipolyticum DSM 21995 TaxID=1227482 RepID=M0NUV7_9EURY|nr:hypothetical protein [Halorubrum lipolyticum]EMA60365.1 hypothetical protein C469_08760 [Halorubrum lipolyticum DSM 21995]